MTKNVLIGEGPMLLLEQLKMWKNNIFSFLEPPGGYFYAYFVSIPSELFYQSQIASDKIGGWVGWFGGYKCKPMYTIGSTTCMDDDYVKKIGNISKEMRYSKIWFFEWK